jgi:outer membrane murein-binding lipoprotein Lpp
MARMTNQMVVGAAALGLLAGTAAAQQDDFNRPLSRTTERAAQPGVSNSRIQISSQEGDQTYEVSIVDGDVSAKVNGRKVPAERIRRSKDKVEILDKNGEVLKSFEINLAAPRALRGWTAIGGEPNAAAVVARPRVMIGITMSEDEDGVAVDHVYEGLPAAKAGLKAGDVIIEIDGKGDLTQKLFREVLNAKEAGDKVKLKVRRDGQEKELTVELQKFDSERLGGGALNMADPAMPKEAWRDAFLGNEEWQKRLEEMMRAAPGQRRAFVWGNGPEGDFRFMPLAPLGGGEEKRLEELNAQMDKKMAELDKKIAKLNEQMAKLEKMMERLAERQRD